MRTSRNFYLCELSLIQRALGMVAVTAFSLVGLVPVQVKAQSAPTIITQPQSTAVGLGSNAVFSVSASGTGPLTYQWYFNGTNQLKLINTVAGNGTSGFSGDGGPATNAACQTFGVGVDHWGNVFIDDPNDQRIRKVDTNGIITTVAGNGGEGYSGDGEAATNATLYEPENVTPDGQGNFFIPDGGNQRIRKVDTNGVISTVAGNGGRGYSGDGGPATNATMNIPSDVTVDTLGNLYFSDGENGCIRKVDLNGIITTIAGTGTNGYSGDGGPATNAMLYYPSGVVLDNAGNLFIADAYNERIRKVDMNGIITTVAGTGINSYSGDGGAATNAALNQPYGVALDTANNLYIADCYNGRIRKVDTNGIITTIAGGGSPISIGDGGSAVNATLAQPFAVAVDDSGNVFIADDAHNRIRKVAPANGSTLTLNQITGADAGNYVVVVSNAYGSVTSSVAALTVDFPPTILTQPKSQFVFTSQSFNLGVSWSGTPPWTFQWQQDSNNLSDNANISGSTFGSLTIREASFTNAGNYTVIISNAWGSVTSKVASVGVFYIEPTNEDVFSGSTAAFNVLLYNGGSSLTNGPFSYQWLSMGKVSVNNVITTFAGTNSIGYSGDGGPAIVAKISSAQGVAFDNPGNLFIADTKLSHIRKVDTHGIITTVAGTNSTGYSGDGGPAILAKLGEPGGIYVDPSGNLIIADTLNARIRKVDTNGIISTVAGNGITGYFGDGGAATNARLYSPFGVTEDNLGNLFIADTFNGRIRKVDTNGIITTVAGTGIPGYSGDGGVATNAKLNQPYGVAIDSANNLIIVDSQNNRIRKVDTNGIITTIAGTGVGSYSGDGRAATQATLYDPNGVTVDSQGNLFIADTYNQVIRRVDTNGYIITVAGTGTGSYSGDGLVATHATLRYPDGLAMDSQGNLFIADSGNARIRKVSELDVSVLDLNNVGVTNAGNYSVIVSTPYGSVTSPQVPLTVVTPLVNGVHWNAGGNVLLNFTGLPNTTSRVWAASSLSPPIAWQPIFTNTTTSISGTWQFTDTNVPAGSRYYRFSTP